MQVCKALARVLRLPHIKRSHSNSLWSSLMLDRNLTNKNRRIVAPLLPTNAQKLIDERRTSIEGSSDSSVKSRPSSSSNTPSKSSTQSSTKPGQVPPRKPTGRDLETARYSGRALVEWQQVLMECRNFYTRRRQEGVPKDSLGGDPCHGSSRVSGCLVKTDVAIYRCVILGSFGKTAGHIQDTITMDSRT